MSKSKDAREPKAQLEFMKLSMRLARMHLTPYGSYKSRHDFTQPQLMTCLVLRSYWKTTYREGGDRAAGGQRGAASCDGGDV